MLHHSPKGNKSDYMIYNLLASLAKSEYKLVQSKHKTPIAARAARDARIERRRKANKAAKVSRRKNRKP